MTIEEECAQATDQIPELIPGVVVATAPVSERAQKSETLRLGRRTVMEARLKDGTIAVCHGARCFTPREPLERAASSDELRAQLRAAIERATAPRSTPEAIRQAEAAIREDAKDRVYTSDDLRALWRLALLRGGH